MDQVQGFRIAGTQTYVSISQIIEDFENGDGVFDLAEHFGEPEIAIEYLLREELAALRKALEVADIRNGVPQLLPVRVGGMTMRGSVK